MRHMTRSQRAKVRGGATWSSNAKGDRWSRHVEQVEQANDSGEWWSRQVASENSTSHRPSTSTVNSSCDGLIMVLGGQLFRSFKLVGKQGRKALTQMDRACNNPDAQVIFPGDVRSKPKPADMKASGTSHRVYFVTFLFDTNSTLIVTWGNFVQYFSLQGKVYLWYWLAIPDLCSP
jgi:hypothetical protein